MKFNYTFEEIKALIVLLAVIMFGLVILVMSYIEPLEFNNEYLMLLNMIVGALIGILAPQGVKKITDSLNVKEELPRPTPKDIPPIKEVDTEEGV